MFVVKKYFFPNNPNWPTINTLIYHNQRLTVWNKKILIEESSSPKHISEKRNNLFHFHPCIWNHKISVTEPYTIFAPSNSTQVPCNHIPSQINPLFVVVVAVRLTFLFLWKHGSRFQEGFRGTIFNTTLYCYGLKLSFTLLWSQTII